MAITVPMCPAYASIARLLAIVRETRAVYTAYVCASTKYNEKLQVFVARNPGILG